MSDRFFPLAPDRLARRIIEELHAGGTIFGLHRENFFIPSPADPFRCEFLGELLETPVGPAAGPHTQLAPNIITAWLSGARYFELKTIQVLDDLAIARPCIDMEDLGYNCEWSQELTIDESITQYAAAWAVIHGLRRLFNHAGPRGFQFNISVGYDLKGIKSDKVSNFIDESFYGGPRIRAAVEAVAAVLPGIDIEPLSRGFARSVTLSTMHGCPPEEIESIAEHLLLERCVPTFIKLNPTLLGAAELRSIIAKTGWHDISVPDEAFAHDPRYDDIVPMLTRLSCQAAEKGVFFGVKLTNTLETENRRKVLPDAVHYLSGRLLQPLAASLAARLRQQFGNTIGISFSAGLDADSIAPAFASGLFPLTICSDILKPGGYLRLRQYIDSLKKPITPLTSVQFAAYALDSKASQREGSEAR